MERLLLLLTLDLADQELPLFKWSRMLDLPSCILVLDVKPPILFLLTAHYTNANFKEVFQFKSRISKFNH